MFVVSVSGTHCAGKTTLVNRAATLLGRMGYRVEVVEEVVRRIGKPTPTTSYEEVVLNVTLSELEKAKAKNPDIVIMDRSFFDVALYTLYYMLKGNWSVNEIREGIRLINLAWEYTLRYVDYIIVVHGFERIPIENDGFRLSTETSRLECHAIARTMLIPLAYSLKAESFPIEGDVERDARRLATIIALKAKESRKL